MERADDAADRPEQSGGAMWIALHAGDAVRPASGRCRPGVLGGGVGSYQWHGCVMQQQYQEGYSQVSTVDRRGGSKAVLHVVHGGATGKRLARLRGGRCDGQHRARRRSSFDLLKNGSSILNGTTIWGSGTAAFATISGTFSKHGRGRGGRAGIQGREPRRPAWRDHRPEAWSGGWHAERRPELRAE